MALGEFHDTRGNQEALAAARGELGPVAQETIRAGSQSDEGFVPYNDGFGPFQEWLTDGTLEAMQSPVEDCADEANPVAESMELAAEADFESETNPPSLVEPLPAYEPSDPYRGIEDHMDQLAAESATQCSPADLDGNGLRDEAEAERAERRAAGVSFMDQPGPEYPSMSAYDPSRIGEDPRIAQQAAMDRYVAMSVNPLMGMGAAADHVFGTDGGFEFAGMGLGILAEGRSGKAPRSRVTSRSTQHKALQAARDRPYNPTTEKHHQNVEASKGPKGDAIVAARQRGKAEQRETREGGRTSDPQREAAKRRIRQAEAPDKHHGDGRHGWRTTPAQQLDRAQKNLDPMTGKPIPDKNGVPLPAPQYGASRFLDELSQAKALRHGEKKLAAMIEASPDANQHVVPVRDANGPVGETYFADGTTAESRVTQLVYRRDPLTGEFGQPMTYYPMSPKDPDYAKFAQEAR